MGLPMACMQRFYGQYFLGSFAAGIMLYLQHQHTPTCIQFQASCTRVYSSDPLLRALRIIIATVVGTEDASVVKAFVFYSVDIHHGSYSQNNNAQLTFNYIFSHIIHPYNHSFIRSFILSHLLIHTYSITHSHSFTHSFSLIDFVNQKY